MKKNILITGVSKGLGLELSKLLLQKDYYVFGISRTKNNNIDELLLKYPINFKWLSYDLSDSINIKNEIFKKFIGKETPIHGFVNNAAIAYDDIVTNLKLDTLQKMFDVNVFTPMNITKYCIRQMLLHNIKGSIIHISSISVHTGYKGLSMYAASKGSLEAFSKNTAREWGVLGIRSNCLVAGFMETEMSSTLSAEQKNRIYNRTSLKTSTSIISVAKTIEFLLSNDSDSITGQNIFVDSGTI